MFQSFPQQKKNRPTSPPSTPQNTPVYPPPTGHPPAKRVKLDGLTSAAVSAPPLTPVETQTFSQIDPERAAGITEYIDADLKGWCGILKQRYTDFLVNEINEDGKVVHLTNLEYGGRGKQQTGLGNDQKKETKTETETETEKQEKNDEGGSASLSGEKETSTSAPAPPAPVKEFELSPEDASALTALTSPEITTFCTTLYRSLRKDSAPSPVSQMTTSIIPSKDARVTLHALVRRLFNSKLETQTLTGDDDSKIRIQAATPNTRTDGRKVQKRRGNRGGKKHANPTEKFEDLGGEYCHFLLYKENRDTMQAVNLVGRLLRTGKPGKGGLGFAGTKDRRAVTVQRCSVYRVHANKLAALNEGGPFGLHAGTRVGNFEYKNYGLELGDLNGNEFCITLRECETIGGGVDGLEEVVRTAVERVKDNGFINYFGLQRFGSFSVGTWEVGVQLLLGSWRTAVEKILDYDHATLSSPINTVNADDRARAEACRLFLESYDLDKAAEMAPRKYLAESTILRVLAERGNRSDGKGGGLDYLGAIQAVPRNLRTMYPHAYQSYVWNHVVSARIRMSATAILEGDLVLIPPAVGTSDDVAMEEVDQDGEIVVNLPAEKSTSGRPRDGEEFAKARPLSKEEVESGEWTIKDLVLPTPGWDVIYPQNELLEVYKSIMKEHGLDPLDMKRGHKEYSLPGGYRKVVAGFLDGGCEFEVRKYKGLEQVVSTDMEVLEREGKVGAQKDMEKVEVEGAETEGAGDNMEVDAKEEGESMAVVLRLRLGTSTYATMALRELMREGIRSYKPEFSR